MKRSEISRLAQQDWLNDNSCESFVRTALKAYDAGVEAANLGGTLSRAPGFYPQQPEGVTFKVVESPAIPDGVAVFRDKDGKEVGRITSIG